MSDIVERLRKAYGPDHTDETIVETLPLEAADEIERLRREVQEARAVLHYSDCAVNNAPAFPPGPCDCGGVPVADEIERLRRERDEARAATNSKAAHDILAERRRQIEAEGWTPEHDDMHDDGEIARAAATYAWASQVDRSIRQLNEWSATAVFKRLWPWEPRWWKPKDRRRDLVRAGALILAEIERLDRAALKDRAP